MSAEVSPISVVTALRQSRKGKLSYDRHWTERNSSVERVLKEVTEKIETIAVCSEKENKTNPTDTKSLEETTSSTPKSALSKKFLEDRMRDSLTVLSPLSLDKSRSSVTNSPGLLSPVFVNLNRTEERDIVDPRNIIMSSESSIRSEQSINASLSFSQSCQAEEDPLNMSSFSYPTSDLIKYDKFPRVDVEKLRLPPSMFVGRHDSHNSHNESEIGEEASPEVVQAEVEAELVKYELERKEEAERKVAERKAKWEQKAREKEEELKDQLETIKNQLSQAKQGSRTRPAIDIEKEIEERLKIQLEEREERQKTLILLAKKEEQLAKEKQERKLRIGKQMERLAPLDTQINNNLTRLLELWNNQTDKSVLSEQINNTVPKLIQNCNVIEEARKKVAIGDCGPELFDKLTELDGNIKATTGKIEEELERILREKKEEQEKADQQKKLEEQKAAEEKAKQEQSRQQQEAQQSQPVPQTPQTPQTTPAAPVPVTPSVKTPAVSPDNKAWYEEMSKFKAEYIKDIVFTEQEKTFKFELQKAVNTPLNSLSGVSSAHLQDKVDKLVALLSGEQITQGGKTFSVNQHPHARGFCMALAAKKLANQGEQIVTSDHRLAFPAATFALAIWDKFPEFGNLLLANILMKCPFLAPYHPQQTAGQTDRDYYTALGYLYEKDVIEPQDKYLKRMSGLARLYAALSISHLPKSSSSTSHPQPPTRLWSWLASVLHLSPHTDVTATLMLDILEVAGHTMFNNYGKQFGKLLGFIKTKYFSHLEAVKSEGGPTVRLEQFLATAIRAGSIKEPDGLLKPGFL